MVEEDFGFGYIGQEHADHLMNTLKIYYENITTDWEGKLYFGITMTWDHTKRYLDISIPGYVKQYLHQLNHKIPKNPHYQPYPAPERTYGADSQKMKPIDMSPALPKERVNQIEHIIGKLLYYARGVDNMCLVPLSTMVTRSHPIEKY